MSEDLSPSRDMLAQLIDVETAATRFGNTRMLRGTDKVRAAVMLTLSDGVAKHTAEETGVPRGLVANLGETIAEASGAERALHAAKGAMTAATTPLPMHMDINAFVQAVLRECYLIQNEILKDYADKVKALNEVKKRIRKKLRQARELSSALENGDPLPEDFEFELFIDGTEWERQTAPPESDTQFGGDGSADGGVLGGAQLSDAAQPAQTSNTVSSSSAASTGASLPSFDAPPSDQAPPDQIPPDDQVGGEPPFFDEEMESYIKTLEEQLDTIGDDAQLANVDLQNALQKQQQTLQMMSNISKVLHDTAMAIIRKIGS